MTQSTIRISQAESACIFEATKEFAIPVDLGAGDTALEPEEIRTIYDAVQALKERGYSLGESGINTVSSVLDKLQRLV